MFNGSAVYGCFLDASKAFDKVIHLNLFTKLLEKDMPATLGRFLISWYRDQRMGVRWCSSLSSPFSVSNGVRQGGVLSPILFAIYLDELLNSLKKSGYGCHCDNQFVGAVCYADDIALLAPSVSALRMMLRTCEEFAVRHGLSFNPSKTQLIRFGKQPSSSCSAVVYLCGSQLSFVNTVVHLGHLLEYNLSDSADILAKTRDFTRKANLMLYTFSAADPFVKTRLLQSFCLSLHGCPHWSLSCTALSSLEVDLAFNNVLRRIWGLPRNCHTWILHLTAHLPSIFNVVSSRSSTLLNCALKCPSSVVRSVFQKCSTLVYTCTGYNHSCHSEHTKTYFAQDGVCASVIRHRHFSHLDPDITDMINIISCS